MNDLREFRMTEAAVRTTVVVGVVVCLLFAHASTSYAQTLRSGGNEYNQRTIHHPWAEASSQYVEPEWAEQSEHEDNLVELPAQETPSIQPLSFGDEAGLNQDSGTPVTESVFQNPVEIVPQTAMQQTSHANQQVVHSHPHTHQWSVLPNDLLFRSYLGGPREPRMASQILHSSRYGTVWELEAGGRVGILRYGTPEGSKPEGWQLDVEGAAFPRLNFDESLELDAVDFKVGVPLTWAEGPYQFEVAIYHLSSHVGDEFLLRPSNEGFNRLDYLRDAVTMGFGYFVNPDWRVYSEIEYAFRTNDGAEPWHFQFGFDYMPAKPRNPYKPVPFFAVNGQLREEVNFGGGINVVGGIAWKGRTSGRIFRAGVQYYNGESFQLSFYDEHEQLIGAGIWYDF